MAPHWAIVVGWVSLGLALTSSAVIVTDELILGHRQHMWIMNVVHPITALYLGPLWLWPYFTRARRSAHRMMEKAAEQHTRHGTEPGQLKQAAESRRDTDITGWHVANADSHCGAGCTLGDICGEWIVFAAGWTIAGATLWPELILDFAFAWTLGIVFQYFTIVPMRSDVGRLQGLWLAARADTLSIVAFQVGLFGWMILSAKVLWQPPLPIDSSAHWWMMQVGMIVGFATAYPVNRLLIKTGWKEKMDHRRHLAQMVEHERAA